MIFQYVHYVILICCRYILQVALHGNDVYHQLKNLEKKLVVVEQANFELSSYIKVKRSATNYEDLKKMALEMLSEYNGLLQERILMWATNGFSVNNFVNIIY